MKKRAHRLRLLAGALLCLYVASYFTWSRIAARSMRELGGEGFYFVFPQDRATRYVNRACIFFYYPLILFERLLGTGSGIAGEPMEKLSGVFLRSLRISASDASIFSGGSHPSPPENLRERRRTASEG